MAKKGRTDAYEVLKDAIATMDLDIQPLKEKVEAEGSKGLGLGEADRLGKYARVLADCTNKQPQWNDERVKAMKAEDLKALVSLASKELRERAGVS